MNKSGKGPNFLSPRSSGRIHTVSGIVLNYEGSSDLTYVRSPDVSERGMFVNTSRSFPEGAIVNVRFRLALSGASIAARGEVRYCLPGVGIGLEFCDLDASTRKLLENEMSLAKTRRVGSERSLGHSQKVSASRARARKRTRW